MTIEVFFNRPDRPIDIDRLLAEIKRSRYLCIASAWFTDTAIAEAFTTSNAQRKIILLNKSDIQRGEKRAYKIVQQWEEKDMSEVLNKVESGVFILGNGDWQQGVMHHKFIVIDMSIVWTGSYNFTFQARRNYETLIRIADASIARLFWREAEELRDKAIDADIGSVWQSGDPVKCSSCGKFFEEGQMAWMGTGNEGECSDCAARDGTALF